MTADVHGYFNELKEALTEQGFFKDQDPHKLIICGDLYDRGTEALQIQAFILELLAQDRVILIRGNHEDLTMNLLKNWHRCSYLQTHHHTNGTIDTLCQLTGTSIKDIYTDAENVGRTILKNPYIQKIIPTMIDYYETTHYVFTHGWIPCTPVRIASNKMEYVPVTDWRNADKTMWDKARWINGMEAAHAGIIEPTKTIVCGHWHCSFGHSRYENDGGEFDNTPNFSPYYGKGIIALDACTPVSKKVNCIVIED
ncbi:metallophosphoesterase [Bullifex porci]|uniref:metallophosphoesterase n=1 Tax=Bullifex porci TaxID=2606638 RepID=UPI0023F14154|nr:metallophosphoesterase [Bullifex porci]MDD7255180.1 metallophosphoesterase [Bullifex porci]MDY2740760.1 metallophosphoesterase [Bullifex porci]